MNDKTIVVLRGIGGNFKSSITKNLVNQGYVQIPESNREFERILSANFNRTSDPGLNYCVKYVVTKAFLNNNFNRYVSDRGLTDYGLMNEFAGKVLIHYKQIHSEEVNTQELFNQEVAMFNGYRMINVLLLTTDINFIKKIIDESYDERATFFDNYKWYLDCQEIYKEFVLSHYNNILTLELDKIPNAKKYSDEMNKYVDSLSHKILNFINGTN